MSDYKMRERFEAWARSRDTILMRADDNGRYPSPFAQSAWEAWQAALSAPEAEAVAWASEQHVMLLAIDLASEEFDDPHEVLYEGFPPEPWGSAWQRFEGEAKRMIERVTAIVAPAHSEQAAVPEGFMPVPLEPTPEMCACGIEDEGNTIRFGDIYAKGLYKQMLAAAPSAPAVKESLTTAGAVQAGDGRVNASEKATDDAADAKRWRELVETWGGMQDRGSYVEIGISTPRWRAPVEVESFNDAFDRRYELDAIPAAPQEPRT